MIKPLPHQKFTVIKVLAHSLIFLIQSIIYTMGNAVYQDILIYLDIIKPDETNETPQLVGYMAGAFFLGKVISDPFYGYCRDRIGDKPTITIVTTLLFISLFFFGISTNVIFLSLSLASIGFNSGMFIPGTAFMNWAHPKDRDTLSLFINLAMGAGILLGPFIGSSLINWFPQPKILYSYVSVGVVMMFITALFLFVFRNVQSEELIAPSDYQKLEEIRVSKIGDMSSSRQNNPQLSSRDEDLNSHNRSIDGHEREGGLFMNREKISKYEGIQIIFEDSSARNLVIIYGISWMVKLIDWMLFAIWAEIQIDQGGLGFDSFRVGLISLMSFPISGSITMIAYIYLSKGKRTTWISTMFYI